MLLNRTFHTFCENFNYQNQLEKNNLMTYDLASKLFSQIKKKQINSILTRNAWNQTIDACVTTGLIVPWIANIWETPEMLLF